MRTHVLAATLLLTALSAFAQEKPPSEKVQKALSADVRAVLEKAETLEVLSLICERQPKEGEDVFRGYPVKKRVKVGADARAALVAEVYRGVDEGGPIARCFEPHHGLHAKLGDETVDLVICFECLQLRIHAGGRPSTVPTTRAAAGALAKLLGEPVVAEAPVEVKVYDGKTAKEWAEAVAKSGVTRWSGALPAEVAPAVSALATAMKDDPDPVTRTRAAAALAKIGAKGAQAAPVVAEALAAAKEKRDRVNALNVLLGLGAAAEPAVPSLEKILDDAKDPLQLRALEVLMAIGPGAKRTAPLIVRWSSPDRDEVHVVQGAVALAKIGANDETTVSTLVARLSNNAKWNVRRVIVQALGDLRATSAKPAIDKAKDDEDPRVQLAARIALAQLAGDAKAALPLVEKALLPDEEQVLRRFAAGDLRRVAGADAVPLLAKLVEDDADDWVRQVAAEALGELGAAAKAALPSLESAAKRKASPVLRERIAEALERVKGD